MRAARARRRGLCANVAKYPTGALTVGASFLGGGGALGAPAPLSALGGGGGLGMRRPFGSRGGLPCPRRRQGSSGANGAALFDARQGPARAGAVKQGGAAEFRAREDLAP